VDKFVVYDDAKYMKGKYINRNYFPELFTFRLKKHPDHAKINECYFYNIGEDKRRFVKETGIRSRFVETLNGEKDVAWNCAMTISLICVELGIPTPIYMASDYPHGKFAEGVVDIVKALGGDTYVNLPGGKSIYTQDMFGDIKLEFIETQPGPSILCEI
jgi:hypothetical protein